MQLASKFEFEDEDQYDEEDGEEETNNQNDDSNLEDALKEHLSPSSPHLSSSSSKITNLKL